MEPLSGGREFWGLEKRRCGCAHLGLLVQTGAIVVLVVDRHALEAGLEGSGRHDGDDGVCFLFALAAIELLWPASSSSSSVGGRERSGGSGSNQCLGAQRQGSAVEGRRDWVEGSLSVTYNRWLMDAWGRVDQKRRRAGGWGFIYPQDPAVAWATGAVGRCAVCLANRRRGLRGPAHCNAGHCPHSPEPTEYRPLHRWAPTVTD